AEVNIKLAFENKSEKDKKAYFEMLHTTVIRVEESAVNKDELKNRPNFGDQNKWSKVIFPCFRINIAFCLIHDLIQNWNDVPDNGNHQKKAVTARYNRKPSQSK
ncbi:MAG: hypothetical protein ACPHIS_11215, partial [Paracoccaceae bacterium]